MDYSNNIKMWAESIEPKQEIHEANDSDVSLKEFLDGIKAMLQEYNLKPKDVTLHFMKKGQYFPLNRGANPSGSCDFGYVAANPGDKAGDMYIILGNPYRW